MIFSSQGRVLSKIDALLDRLSHVDHRIRGYEELHQGVGGMLGPASELYEMRSAHDDIRETLLDARGGIKSGAIDYRVIAKQLPAVHQAVGHFERVLRETDAAAAAGRAAFKARFGG